MPPDSAAGMRSWRLQQGWLGLDAYQKLIPATEAPLGSDDGA
jgi:hypothetical protein